MSVQRKGDHWHPVLYLRDPLTGKERHKWYDGYSDKKQAEAEERKLRVQADQGTLIDTSAETMAAFLTRWLRHKHTDGTAPTTYQRYVDIVNGRLIPAFGALRAACAGLLSDTITLRCCVTLPTMALPPSATDTFCTVMAGSPRLR